MNTKHTPDTKINQLEKSNLLKNEIILKLQDDKKRLLDLLSDIKFTLNFRTHDEKQNKLMNIDIKRIERIIKDETK